MALSYLQKGIEVKIYKINTGTGTYKIEATDMLIVGDFVELVKDGKSIAIFYRPVCVILIDD